MDHAEPRILVDYSRLEGTVFAPAWAHTLDTMVVGAGALGNEVVKVLGLLGVGGITIVDSDTIEPSNLTRSVLFRSPEACGRNKAVVLSEATIDLFPDSQVAAIPREIADVGFDRIRKVDIIFGCVDSDLARLEIAYISTKLGMPVSDGGLGGPNYSRGRVSYFPGRFGACYGCRLTSQRRRELLTLWDSQARPCWGPSIEISDHAYPSTPAMAAVVGAMQVEIGLRKLLSRQNTSGTAAETVEIELDPIPKLENLKTKLSSACPFHNQNSRTLLFESSPMATAGDLLDRAACQGVPGAMVVLDWPLCIRARCLKCSHSWRPMLRLGAFRRTGHCPNCASRQILEQEILKVIEHGSSWADVPLSQLGLPDHHCYSLAQQWDGNK